MKRITDIRDIYHWAAKKRPGAFVAILAGCFVSFLFEQADEVGRILGEPVSATDPYRVLRVHYLKFAEAVRAVQLVTGRMVVLVERVQNGTVFAGPREVKVFEPVSSKTDGAPR